MARILYIWYVVDMVVLPCAMTFFMQFTDEYLYVNGAAMQASPSSGIV